MIKMTTRPNMIVLGYAAAVGFWLLEAFIHAYVFNMHSIQDELLPMMDSHELWMRVLICIGFIVFGYFTQRLLNTLNEEKKRVELVHADLQRAMDEIKTLQGIIPICASCKKIRDDNGAWSQIESYIRKRTDVEFSHGMCPECAEKTKQEFLDFQERAKKAQRMS